jgi:hypothetical protein
MTDPQTNGSRVPPWSSVVAEPGMHDRDVVWFSDHLVTVIGEKYPPRFRCRLTCEGTGVSVCVAVRVERGGFLISEMRLNPAPPEIMGKIVPPLTTGHQPALAWFIAQIPSFVTAIRAGGWMWSSNVVVSWTHSKTQTSDAQKRAEFEAWLARPLTTAEWRGFTAPERAVKRRMVEVRRRMRQSWWTRVLPDLEQYTEFMHNRGLDRDELVTALQKQGLSRSQAYAQVALAGEVGLLGGKQPPRLLSLSGTFSPPAHLEMLPRLKVHLVDSDGCCWPVTSAQAAPLASSKIHHDDLSTYLDDLHRLTAEADR